MDSNRLAPPQHVGMPLPGGGARADRLEHLTFGLLLASFVVLAHTYSRLYHHQVVDDSLISLQYVKNFVRGDGLVFNLGERVEGYTNFLWIIALAPAYALASWTGQDFVRVAVEVSIVIAAIDLMLLYRLARDEWESPVAALLALTLCAVDNAYAVWAMQAMECHFLAFWVLLSLTVVRSQWRHRGALLGVTLACVQMTRPDGLWFALALGLTQVWFIARGHAGRRDVLSVRELVQAVVVGAAVYGAYFAWRYQYYGHLLPNTFYLKVGTSKLDAWERGARYVHEYFSDRYYLPLLAVPALGWVARSPLLCVAALYLPIQMLYLAYVGGDFYAGQRFMIVLTPLFVLLQLQTLWGLAHWLAARLRSLVHGAVRASHVLFAIGVVCAGCTLAIGVERGPLELEILRWGGVVRDQADAMRWLNLHSKPGETIVAGDIGSTGYYTSLHVYDVFGIIDPVIAHRDVPLGGGKVGHEKRGDLGYFLPKRPTYIKTGYVGSDLYPFGYVLTADMPCGNPYAPIWQRDTLPERATELVGLRMDFSRSQPRWRRTGNAFGSRPIERSPRGQQAVLGRRGAYVSSFHPTRRDAATGTLTSPEFILEGDLLELRVAGGCDPERLRVTLLVAGRAVRSATGHDSEILARKLWDIAPYRGRSAQIEIVDQSSAGWGHIMVDEILQWRLNATPR